MHGHRMRSDFDLDSVFVPHSRSFSLCSSVVGEVCNSSHSINSCGEHGSALGHKNSCNLHSAGVLGGTQALSMSTWLRFGRPAVEKLASPQQAPGRLHEDAWAGLSQKQGLRISQEVDIVPGCAVAVACPSCLDFSLEPPGRGRSSVVFGLLLVWVSLRTGSGLGCLIRSSAGGGRGSVEAWYTTALDIEDVLTGATDSDVYLFVADVIKSSDTVDRGILDRVFE